jgi:hypothetical protein
MDALTAERERIAAELAAADEDDKVVALHPAALASYRHDLEELAEGINRSFGEADQRAIDAFRSLVETVTTEHSVVGEKSSCRSAAALASCWMTVCSPRARGVGGTVGSGGTLQPFSH